MHASVLIILHEGHKMLQVHASEAASWKALLGFVEQQWQARFGSLLPPLDETKRIEAQLEQCFWKRHFCSMTCTHRRECYHYIFGFG